MIICSYPHHKEFTIGNYQNIDFNVKHITNIKAIKGLSDVGIKAASSLGKLLA